MKLEPSRPPWLAPTAAAVGIAVLVSGCMVGPDFKPSKPYNTPPGFIGTTPATNSQPAVTSAEPGDLSQWWQKFNDVELTRLIEQAGTNNLDMQLALARIRQARFPGSGRRRPLALD
jgi:outer membrane protein TolC